MEVAIRVGEGGGLESRGGANISRPTNRGGIPWLIWRPIWKVGILQVIVGGFMIANGGAT